MLYRTHHPFFFQFHTFPSSISPSAPATTTSTITPSLPSVSLSKFSPSLQVETEMECVEAAMKTSFKKEMAVKSSPQAGFEDLWTVNAQNGVSCDDFFVDELLDLSNEDGFVEQDPKEEEEEEDDDEDKGFVSVSSQQDRENSNRSTTFSAKDQFATEPTSELSVPADDLADLEWLSHFVEDSFSEFSAAYHLPTGILTEKPKNKVPEPEREPKTPVSTQPYFKTPVPAKARSKRTRTGGRVWSLGSPSLTESSSSSTSSSSSSSPSTPLLIYTNTALNMEPVEPVYPYGKPPPAKKQKKKPAPASDSAAAWGGVAQPPRRCTHCGVQKTPQWRTGPLGAKTLCNACGVRYKSGRLLPEYRPACSPTYSSDLHSNHHRKVLEMRRKKEPPGGTESGLAPTVVPSF